MGVLYFVDRAKSENEKGVDAKSHREVKHLGTPEALTKINLKDSKKQMGPELTINFDGLSLEFIKS